MTAVRDVLYVLPAARTKPPALHSHTSHGRAAASSRSVAVPCVQLFCLAALSPFLSPIVLWAGRHFQRVSLQGCPAVLPAIPGSTVAVPWSPALPLRQMQPRARWGNGCNTRARLHRVDMSIRHRWPVVSCQWLTCPIRPRETDA